MALCEMHADTKETIKDHERRIAVLERHHTEFSVRMENLCSKLEELTSWIKTLVFLMVTTGLGFLIWYIQSLPR